MGGIRNSDVAKAALARAQASPLVLQRLGPGIDEGWLLTGSINVSAGGSGDADLAVPISGPKGKGAVYVTAKKGSGTWNYSQMVAVIEGSGERIDLLAPSLAAQTAPPAFQPGEPASFPAAAPPAAASTAPEPPTPEPPVTEQAAVIHTQETNVEGVVSELIECRRSEGVLTIKVRFRNTSSKPEHLTFIHWGATSLDLPKFYVTAGNKKYFVLKDTDGTVLSSNSADSDTDLGPGRTYLWWGKYPAPPPEVKKVNFMMPFTPPFEDVPITDK